MHKYAIYENVGELDMRAFTIMGVNSKPNTDSPIGFFGTGLKYAVAVLMRFDQQLYVQNGDGRQAWTARKRLTTFRDKTFDEVYLSRDPFNDHTSDQHLVLPFTTELGKNWQLWMVMRELECNARDEGGRFYFSDEIPSPQAGTVRVIVAGQTYIQTVNNQRSEVFFDQRGGEIIADNEYFDIIWNQPSRGMYYRGILVTSFGTQMPSYQHTYNLKKHLELTEDRTTKYEWAWQGMFNIAWTRTASNEWRASLMRNKEAGEWKELFQASYSAYAKEVIKFIADEVDRGGYVNHYVSTALLRHRIEVDLQKERVLMADEQHMLDAAIDRLSVCGYIINDYSIKVANELPQSVLGLADYTTSTIILAGRNFEMGLETVMGTLLEEYAHLKHQVHDESREMQDWLLRQTIVSCQRYLRTIRYDRAEDTRRLDPTFQVDAGSGSDRLSKLASAPEDGGHSVSSDALVPKSIREATARHTGVDESRTGQQSDRQEGATLPEVPQPPFSDDEIPF